MKKLLLIILMISSKLLFSQISMIPPNTHYNNAYPVTISGNGTIYYTTDGTTPTLSSNSAINSVQITINQNKEIKAFIVNSQAVSSSIVSKKYYVGTIPTSLIYFKPPSTWTMGAGVLIDMVNPNSYNGGFVDFFWPGLPMTNTGCEGWYKSIYIYYNANLIFTNNSIIQSVGGISTNLIPAGSVIYYDFSAGEISNPPACLFLNTAESNSNDKVTMIKIYPNPVSEILKVSTNINFQEYEITDITGKMIVRKKFSKEISVNHLSSGKYFIKLTNNEGNLTLLKFIKK